ncbi:MAG: aldo/keto reductase [Leptolyngbya sp. SIO1E4]|nr:aldo/keto reductase [Leptolyngbya sp. SIO1E4]
MLRQYRQTLVKQLHQGTDLLRELTPVQLAGGLIQPEDVTMQYTTLGRTGLQVSAMALGSGGSSQLGRKTGKSSKQSRALVRRAYELGVNFFDSAHDYKNEAIIGAALKGIPRETFVLSSKCRSHQNTIPVDPATVRARLEQSLRDLKTDYIDIYHLASVQIGDYQYVVNELVPVLLQLREEGKIRFLGITEKFDTDTQHRMLSRALQDNVWDVVMVGFNFLNQTARHVVLPAAQQKRVGVMNMFAVRRSLSSLQRLQEALNQLAQQGVIDTGYLEKNNPLDFLISPVGATSLTDAAYRYCHHEPGVHTVMFGTGSLEHLESNIVSILRPPLPVQDVERLNRLFAQVTQFSGN